MQIDLFNDLFTLRIQYAYTQTQCEDGAKYGIFNVRTPIIW